MKRWMVVLIGMLVCMTGCVGDAASEQIGTVSEAALTGSALYVHNVTCSDRYEKRTVPESESEFLDKVIERSITAEPFRPLISPDIILGSEPEVYYVFDDGKVLYTFNFFQVEKQLDIGFVHREKPLISISKVVADERGQFKKEWGWKCTLPPAAYAELYEMTLRYTGGEIV